MIFGGGRRQRVGLAAGALVFVGLALAFAVRKPTGPDKGATGNQQAVVARGRIEPADRARTVQGPTGSVIQNLKVREGDKVAVGTLLAEIDTRPALAAALAMEEKRLTEAERQLTQISAPAKRADVEAQSASVRRLRVEWERAQRDYERTKSLEGRGFASNEVLDTRRAAMDQAQHALEQAEWTYRSLLKPRDIDVDVAAAKVATQKDAVAKAKADLARTEIRAPIDGTILTIMVRAGEALGSDGLLQMGDLSNLIAIAEVDEFDIGKVTEGRTATISGPSVPTAIAGKVSRISRAVYKQKRPSSDVLVGRDANIVEVEITPASPLPPVVWGEITVKIAGAP